MTAPGIGPVGGPPPRDSRAELRRLSQQLEGVFLSQLFQAMRQSVREQGLTNPSPGEEMFTSLMDDALANQAATHMHRGLGEALYHQLVKRLPGGGEPSAPTRTP